MKKLKLERDIKVFYVTAKSFPEGINQAMDELGKLLGKFSKRNIFGISRPENGGNIVYKAATEELESGEAEKYGCKTLTIKKGEYVSIDITDVRKNIPAISSAFDELLKTPGIDPDGYCIEWYTPDMEAVKCMVRLNE